MSRSQDLAKLFETLARMSSSIDGGILTSSNSAILRLSTQDPVQSKPRDYVKFINTSFALTSCKESTFNPARNLRLALQEGEKKEDLTWELWSKSRLLQVKDLKKSHSVLASSISFGKAAWSDDSKFVVYIAENIPKKSASFWSGEENSGNQHVYKENFGEGLKHIVDPSLYVYKIDSNEVSQIKHPQNIWPAHPVFYPGTKDLYFIGFDKGPYKLGLAAMLNRKTKLYKASIADESVEEIQTGNEYMGVLYPKFSPDGRYLAYYGVPLGSISHCMCISLVLKDMNTGEIREVVPRVQEYNEKFNGIYGFHENISTYNWLNDNTLVFTTNHDASECLFSVNLSGEIQEIQMPIAKPYSCSILDISHNSVLAKASNFHSPEQVYLLNKDSNLSPVLIENGAHEDLNDKEREIRENLNKIQTSFIVNDSAPLKSVLYHKEGNKNLLALLHGGPHSTGLVSYTLTSSLRALQDLSLLVINYSGSLGFGSSHLDSLLGRIGELDVNDCIETINKARLITGCEKLIVSGGSHGGFLSSHLASRIELAGAVTINGVSDVASMQMTTDINDWGLAEVCKTDLVLPPTADQYRAMYEASPIFRANLINCPVLICGGSADLRVPASSSQALFRVLKANGKDCQMFWYNDEGHGILGKAAGFDLIINTTAWILDRFEGKV